MDGEKKGSHIEKLYKDAEYSRKKREELHSLVVNKDDEELKECTFQPHSDKADKKRTHTQFLDDQNKFIKEKDEKMKKIQ